MAFNIMKRSGVEVPFDGEKIVNAVRKANAEIDPIHQMSDVQIQAIADGIRKDCESMNRAVSVEEIQEMVEHGIMEMRGFEVAQSYIRYRFKRNMARVSNTTDDEILELVERNNEDAKQENSNKNPVINSTQRDYIAGMVSRDITNRILLPEEVVNAHKDGAIHFHDSDYFISHEHNCELVNLQDMLQNGTVITSTRIETPKSFATACNIATQIIAQVASNTYGGQSVSLAHLAPFVDVSRQKIRRCLAEEMADVDIGLDEEAIERIVAKRLRREIVAGIQTINYQLVTLMTTNGQTPFVTLWMYLDEVPEGQTRDDLAMIIEEVLNQRIQGLPDEKGAWVTPAFPKLVYVLDEDNIHDDSKYIELTKLAAKCTAKRLVPDYVSAKIMKQLKGDVYPPMGCRSFLTPDTEGLNADGSHKYYGRFNQGVVTINLPYIACLAEGDMDKFWQIFDEYLEICHKGLRCRHERLRGTPSDVAPILWQYGALARLEKGETIDKLLYNNYSTLSLGYAGLYEMCVRMTGRSHTDPEIGKPFALAVMQHLNDKTAEWRAAENISYSLYGTPMESGTYKFAQALQKKFGVIKDVSDHNYITNSYHINVREEVDAFTKLTFEAEFQALSPGGAISYVEVPNMQDNLEAVLAVMRHIYDTIIYAELNTKSDHCDECDYDGEIEIVTDENGKLIWRCPNCGNTNQNTMHVARRTCGYIGTNYWNQGRTQEIRDRVLHL